MKNNDLLQKALSGAISEEDLVKECYLLPVGDAIDLIKEYGLIKSGGQITSFFRTWTDKYPELVVDLKERLEKEYKVEEPISKD